jgi:DNA helicase-2/ATP-dependent DNA helicase PcrA
METLERIALTTGMSTWDAIARATEEQLLPARALQALGKFRRLIEDGRAMLGPDFAKKLASDVGLVDDDLVAEGDTSFDGASFAEEPAVVTGADAVADTSFDTSFNFGFDFGPSEEMSTIAPENARDTDAVHGIDAAEFNPFAPVVLKDAAGDPAEKAAERVMADEGAFRKPGEAATLPELIKFLNDRSGYIRALEEEATPESFSRIENLKELANAAQDAQERGETLSEFLDHAALVSDADSYSAEARVTLMTLHAAKGLEFPLVFMAGMEEGVFPSSRTLVDPTGLEEERRLCYVGMTRAMDTLVMTRARYRRRYGSDMPETSIPSRFLEEVPARLMEDLGSPVARPQFSGGFAGGAYATPYPQRGRFGRPRDAEDAGEQHYSYEDEDQSAAGVGGRGGATKFSTTRIAPGSRPVAASGAGTGKTGAGSSVDNITNFFTGRGGRFSRPKIEVPAATGKTGLRQGSRVRHPKYGEGTVFRREGDGDDAKITVQFQQHGVKKLVEKFAQLEAI